MAEIKITKENFNDEVMNSDIPVLLDFWAEWCGPCMMLSPVIEEIAKEYDEKLKVGKINVDEEVELSSAFKISGIPCVFILNKGEIIETFVGYKTKEAIVPLLENII